MNKVVYNACFGGFSLSQKAVLLAQSYSTKDSPWQEIDPRYGYIDGQEIERHDPVLVRVVEELGKEASGSCADVCVEEINSPMYRIDEYDGREFVETPGDVKWVVIY